MYVEVLEYDENPDGSVTVTLDVSDDIKLALIQEGFISVLTKFIEQEGAVV